MSGAPSRVASSFVTARRNSMPSCEMRTFTAVENCCRMDAADRQVAERAYERSRSTTITTASGRFMEWASTFGPREYRGTLRPGLRRSPLAKSARSAARDIPCAIEALRRMLPPPKQSPTEGHWGFR
jgi:hypothetical protein